LRRRIVIFRRMDWHCLSDEMHFDYGMQTLFLMYSVHFNFYFIYDTNSRAQHFISKYRPSFSEYSVTFSKCDFFIKFVILIRLYASSPIILKDKVHYIVVYNCMECCSIMSSLQ
jgi:hypothetical protein